MLLDVTEDSRLIPWVVYKGTCCLMQWKVKSSDRCVPQGCISKGELCLLPCLSCTGCLAWGASGLFLVCFCSSQSLQIKLPRVIFFSLQYICLVNPKLTKCHCFLFLPPLPQAVWVSVRYGGQLCAVRRAPLLRALQRLCGELFLGLNEGRICCMARAEKRGKTKAPV